MKPPEFPELFVRDGVDRYYLRGELREQQARFRNRDEGLLMARLVGRLGEWHARTIGWGGEVLCDMGYRLRSDPPTAVGIPVSYIDGPTARADPDDAWWITGPPRLAVEIVRFDEPPDRLAERVGEYLSCGVPLVWVADPVGRSVAVYRPGAGPEMLRDGDEADADPHVPGFSCPVAEFFR